MNAMLTIDQAADLLNVSKTTVYRKVRSGELPGKKVGRSWYFDRQQITEYLRTTRGVQTLELVAEPHHKDEMLPLGPPLWREVYAPQLERFVLSILDMEPDYFVPLARKAARIVDSLVDVPPLLRDRIRFPHALKLIPPDELRNKVVAVFDEVVQYGTTLSFMREECRRRGAKPLTFAFARAKSKFKTREFKDEKAKVALDLDDAEIRQLTAALTEYLILQERPTDVEHPVLAIQFSHPIDDLRITRLAWLLARYGRVWSVPSVAEREGVFAFVLDEPSFFDPSSLLPLGFFEQEGSMKIRVYLRRGSNCLYVTAMAYPKLKVDRAFLAHCAARRDLRRWVTDIVGSCYWLEQEPEDRAKLVYELTTAYLSTVMLARFLALLGAEISTLQSTVAKHSLDTENLRRYFGSRVGDSLIPLILEELKRASLLEMRQPQPWDPMWGNIEWKADLNQGTREVRALFDSQPVVREAAELFHEKLEQGTPSDVCLREGLSRTEIRDRSGIPDASLSEWLDFLLDIGMLAPLYKTYPSNGGWWIARAYRIGETQQGWKGLDREWPGETGTGAEPITHTLNRDVRLIAYVLDRVMRYRKLASGVPSALAEKVLSNIVLEWRNMKRERTYIQVGRYRTGPGLMIPAGPMRPVEYPLPSLIKYGTFSYQENLYTPLNSAVREVREYLTSDEQTFLDQCINIYSQLLSGAQDFTKLLALAIGRDKEMAYYYAYADVEFWIDDFRQFLGHASRVLAGEMEPQQAEPFLNNAANAAVQLTCKITALRLIQQVRTELRSMEEITEPLGRVANDIADTIMEYEIGEGFNALDMVGKFLRVFTSVVKFVLDRAGWPMSRGKSPQKTLKELEDQLNRAAQDIGLESPLLHNLPVEDDSMINDEYLRQRFLPQMNTAYMRILRLLDDRLSRPRDSRLNELSDRVLVLWYLDIWREISNRNLKVGCVVSADFRGITEFIDKGREWYLEAYAMLDAFRQFIRRLEVRSPKSFSRAKERGDGYMLFYLDAVSAAAAASSILEWNTQEYAEGHMLQLGIGLESGEYLAVDEFEPGPPVCHAAHLSEAAAGGVILVGEKAAEDLHNSGFEVVPATETDLKFEYRLDDFSYKVYRLISNR